jgi:hypothetical protein
MLGKQRNNELGNLREFRVYLISNIFCALAFYNLPDAAIKE